MQGCQWRLLLSGYCFTPSQIFAGLADGIIGVQTHASLHASGVKPYPQRAARRQPVGARERQFGFSYSGLLLKDDGINGLSPGWTEALVFFQGTN